MGKDGSFCVTLVDFASPEGRDFESALRSAGKSWGLTVRHQKKASDASYPASVIHAIVFSAQGVAKASAQDVDVIQSATDLGTCRIYFSAASGMAQLPEESSLYNFIQRTYAPDSTSIAEEIISFFRQADSLNRRSTLLAFRDATCLVATKVLQYLWPVSYLFAALHILNSATVLSGREPWFRAQLTPYVIPVSTFFGVFFCIHCIFSVVRNWLFATQIFKRFAYALVLATVAFGMAAAITAYSIIFTDRSVFRIFVSAISAVAIYGSYLYTRRIRSELTSLSQIRAAMDDPQRRDEMLTYIGGRGFRHSSFSLFGLRRRTLFISYMHGSAWSSETATLAHQWASNHGLEVFLDRSTIPSGTLWRKYLLQAISECGYFVAVIDGDTAITNWVLAESAYAALLRKSIGKPRILLIVQNAKRVANDEGNPIRRIYLDVFQLAHASYLGAMILPVDEGQPLTEGRFWEALDAVRPMGLLSPERVSRPPRDRTPAPTIQADSITFNDLQLADRSWRTSVLLCALLEAEGRSVNAVNILVNKGLDWICSYNQGKETVGLNTLRFLFKMDPALCSRNALEKVSQVFVRGTSLAVRLAALDLLGSISTAPNPLVNISEVEAKRIVEFRAEMMKSKQASQLEYAAKGVHRDLATESSGKTYAEALQNAISRVERVSYL